MLRRLDAAAAQRLDDDAHAALARAVEALVGLHPAASEPLGQRVARWPSTSPAFGLTVGALARVGHPRAQAALVHALTSHRDRAERGAVIALLAALGRAPRATPETELALRAVAASPDADLASTARLALGAAARRLLASEPERARAIGRWAADGLRAALTDDPDALGLRHWLRVLGNAGDAAPAGVVGAWLDDPRPEVRATARRALRFVGGAAVGP